MKILLTLQLILISTIIVGCGASTPAVSPMANNQPININEPINNNATPSSIVPPTNGEAAKIIPENFPTDVPLYPDATIKETTTEIDGFIVSLTSIDDFDTLNSWYEEALEKQGWSTEPAIEAFSEDGRTITYSATKGERTLSIGLLQPKDEFTVTILTTILE
ncbi:MAG TPA: hypothetical protein VJB65_02510 [Patescibacteria group bacterium]|nr:hypothetical protein [Patescibacteria group bacterium]